MRVDHCTEGERWGASERASALARAREQARKREREVGECHATQMAVALCCITACACSLRPSFPSSVPGGQRSGVPSGGERRGCGVRAVCERSGVPSGGERRGCGVRAFQHSSVAACGVRAAMADEFQRSSVTACGVQAAMVDADTVSALIFVYRVIGLHPKMWEPVSLCTRKRRHAKMVSMFHVGVCRAPMSGEKSCSDANCPSRSRLQRRSARAVRSSVAPLPNPIPHPPTTPPHPAPHRSSNSQACPRSSKPQLRSECPPPLPRSDAPQSCAYAGAASRQETIPSPRSQGW